MTYELAKELKDAGFHRANQWLRHEGLNEDLPQPTLSELIETCGDGFRSLLRSIEGTWIACGEGADADCLLFYERRSAESPEEAVAKLWLALNRK